MFGLLLLLLLLVGTVWMQQILSQIMEESHPGWAEGATNRAQIPYLEGRTTDDPFRERKDPRIIRTHLLVELLPRGVKDKQIKVMFAAAINHHHVNS